MYLFKILLTSWVAAGVVSGSAVVDAHEVEKRQGSSASSLPTLGSESTASVSVTSSSVPTNTQTSGTVSVTSSASASGSNSGSSSRPQSSGSVSASSTLAPSSTSNASTSTTSTAPNATTSAANANQNVLPLQPHITPALSIAGVILILTGIAYTLVGVKNRWIHIFLSTAYLTSLSIAVLIVYVLNPPVSNAIQGAYFVGIFMTGIIFGAGALIFKEVTEGLGCLLGGFCLSMWFLTLKEGGLITSTSGKAIFISIFCIVSWSLSFSHYTRPYGLMGSIAFSGATVFVLGIDCFSRGGLKEFWIYIWALNDNLFPLNTDTFPITRGTRVETIVIILVCIIGVISQLKLWKIVKDRQSRREAAHQDESRRRDVVEAALGRHLERQNDRDRSQWEKQYGDRLGVKRETILWTDAHAEKGYTKIKETEIKGNQSSSSSENLEMLTLGPKTPRSMYVTRVKRHSSAPIHSIQEMEETEGGEDDPAEGKEKVRQEVLDKLEGNERTGRLEAGNNPAKRSSLSPRVDDRARPNSATSPTENDLRGQSPIPGDRESAVVGSKNDADGNQPSDLQRYLSAPEEPKAKKRRSFSSFFSRSVKDVEASPSVSASQEALVVPDAALSHSRASSLAATLDFENEVMDLPMINTALANSKHTPEIVITPVKDSYDNHDSRARLDIREVPPSPPALSENFDLDPEELVRPPAADASAMANGRRVSSGFDTASKRQSSSEAGTDPMFDDGLTKSRTATSDTSHSEILTKGVLEQVPSQLSHVVLSYRTNEWAKHISTAEAPIFEEPESLEGEASEEPTHLADPVTEAPSKRSSLNQAPPPPELTAPTPSAIPSPTAGMRVNPVIQPEPSPTSSTSTKATPSSRSRSTSEGKQVPRGFRSASTPLLNNKLQPTPIDENAALNFVPPQLNVRSASSASINRMVEPNLPPVGRSSSSLMDHSYQQKSRSRLSLVSESGGPYVAMPMPTRSASQLSNHQPLLAHPQRSETRLESYDSHQPLRRNTSVENHRREALLADWRVSQQKSPDIQTQTERHRQQMLMDHQQVKMMEEQEKALRWQQELAIDARMRGRDMQELHREAMRRMQASANKKL